MTKRTFTFGTIYTSDFNTEERAMKFAYERSLKPQRIILGDDGLFWVVRPVDGEKLVSTGYEMI